MNRHVIGCLVVGGVFLWVFILGALVPFVVEVVLSLTAPLNGH